MELMVSDIGAVIKSIIVPDKNGNKLVELLERSEEGLK